MISIRQLAAVGAVTLSISFATPPSSAQVVVFDPNTIADRATYAKPHQLAVGVEDVLVNGGFAFRDGKPTGAHTGRFVHGRAWLGAPGGACRAAPSDWSWSK